jgi:hypothetical protein
LSGGEDLAVAGLCDRGVHALVGAVVAGIGGGGQVGLGCRPVQGAEHTDGAGTGQVVAADAGEPRIGQELEGAIPGVCLTAAVSPGEVTVLPAKRVRAGVLRGRAEGVVP